jgi:two-component system, sensor histidine kinase RegB
MNASSPAAPSAPARPRPERAPSRDATAFLSTPEITLQWLLRLRWGAVAGQAVTIVVASLLFDLSLPFGSLAVVLGVTMVTNVALHRWMRAKRPVAASLVAAVLAFDTLSLCELLYFTGGPTNPFSVLFLVQITIAALVLGTRYTVGIVALSLVSYAYLFIDNVPLYGMEHAHHGGSGEFTMHLQGMFVAFAVATALIAYFVARVSTALRERDEQLTRAQRAAAANDRLASLSTLSAGAAHELGTPLATIAVASKELDRAAQALPGAEALRDDARLIRQEVDRCRDIVQQMSARAGEALGEIAEEIAPGTIVDELRRRLAATQVARLDVEIAPVAAVKLPWRGLVQSLVSLVRNAFDASGEDDRVALTFDVAAGRARIAIADRGAGIAAGDLQHVGEPFFTTKSPGKGMGLGVFLARSFADRLGGDFSIASSPGTGTRVVLELPVEDT